MDEASFEFYDEDELDLSTPRLDSRSGSQALQGQSQENAAGLPFMPPSEWDQDRIYTEKPPEWVHFVIEWRLMLVKNRRTKLTGNTEQNVVVAPQHFWQEKLKPIVDAAVRKKIPGSNFFADETEITVSVNDRTEHDFEQTYEGQEVDWHEVGDKLLDWSHLFRAGKRLKVKADFMYGERKEKRTRQGTRSQHVDLVNDDEADRLAGRPRIWNRLFSIFECPQSGCKITAPWCWAHPETKERYPVPTELMHLLKNYVEAGGKIETHADVPPHLRDLIISQGVEEKSSAKSKKAIAPTTPPINITNVLHPAEPPRKKIKVGCNLDDAIKQYYIFLCSKISNDKWKRQLKQVAEATFENGIELRRLDEAQDEEAVFLMSICKGLTRGIARMWVSNVPLWLDETQSDDDGREKAISV